MAKKGSNLKPVQSTEEARARGRKGGIASGKARREKSKLKDCLEILLEKEMTDKNGKKITGAEALSIALFKQAMAGNVKAFVALRDTAGQKPPDVVEQTSKTTIDMSGFTTEEIKRMLDDEV